MELLNFPPLLRDEFYAIWELKAMLFCPLPVWIQNSRKYYCFKIFKVYLASRWFLPRNGRTLSYAMPLGPSYVMQIFEIGNSSMCILYALCMCIAGGKRRKWTSVTHVRTVVSENKLRKEINHVLFLEIVRFLNMKMLTSPILKIFVSLFEF